MAYIAFVCGKQGNLLVIEAIWAEGCALIPIEDPIPISVVHPGTDYPATIPPSPHEFSCSIVYAMGGNIMEIVVHYTTPTNSISCVCLLC